MGRPNLYPRLLGAILLGLGLLVGTSALGLLLLGQGRPGLIPALQEAAQERLPYLLLLLLLALLLLWLLLEPLLLGPLRAARALAQEVEILLLNPKHRLKAQGPEWVELARQINRLAEERTRLLERAEEIAAEGRRLLERERERLSALLGHLPHGVVLANPQGLVLLYNPAAKALLGERLAAGQSLFGLLDRELLAYALAFPERAFRFLGPQGPLRLWASPLEEGLLVLLEREEIDPQALEDLYRKVKALASWAREGEAKALAQEALALLQRLDPALAGEALPVPRLLALLGEAFEGQLGLSPGLWLTPEAKGAWVRAKTLPLAQGLVQTLRGLEAPFWLEGGLEDGYLRLTLLLPEKAPPPHPSLGQAVEGVGGALLAQGLALSLLLPLAPKPPLPPSPKGPRRAFLHEAPPPPPSLEEAPLEALRYTALDLETTGLDPEKDAIIAIGAVHLLGGQVLAHETFEALVNPGRPLNPLSQAVHGLREELLRDKPPLDQVLPGLLAFLEGTVLIAHNGAFDLAFLRRAGLEPPPMVDTLLLAHLLFPDLKDHRLETLAQRLGVPVLGRHTAIGDALMAGEIYARLLPLLREKGYRTLRQVLEACGKLPLAQLRY